MTLERGTDGTYLAWVDDLPGCAVRAESRETVLERVPPEIRSFLTWAGADDIPAAVEVEITEEFESAIEADEDTEILVSVDRRALTDEDWRWIAGLLGRSRAELLGLLEALTEDKLANKREGSERTVREEIEHVAFVELMYAAWTFDLESTHGLRAFLAWTREIARERFSALAANEAADVTWANWGGAPRPEPWTPRKAARRLIWHELLHLRAIERFAERSSRPF